MAGRLEGEPEDDDDAGRLVSFPGRVPAKRPDPFDGFSVADFLALDVVGEGDPIVLAGARHLDRQMRWLRAGAEVGADHGSREGELLHLDLRSHPTKDLDRDLLLVGTGLAGLLVQLGDGDAVAETLVRRCETDGLPLIALRRPVALVRLREAAHSAILVIRRRLVDGATRTHERFDELGAADAPVEQLVTTAGELAGCQVVFADLLGRVHAFFAGGSPLDELLSRWQRWTLSRTRPARTHVDGDRCLAVTPVLVHGQRRADLAFFAAHPIDGYELFVLTRAAMAVGARMLVEDERLLEAGAQRSALADIVAGRFATADAVHARTAALGHPTRGRTYVPLVLLDADADAGALLTQSVNRAHVDALTMRIAPGRWAALLLCRGPEQPAGTADLVAAHWAEVCGRARAGRGVLARGTAVDELSAVRGSFEEAIDVALAADAADVTHQGRKLLYSLADIRLRGLLRLLRDEPRVQGFVDRTLGPLLVRDAQDAGDRVLTLASYLRHRGNKSSTAHELGLSRQTLYERLGRIERLLGVDLDDPESSTSLFVAVMVVEDSVTVRRAPLEFVDADGLTTLDTLSRSASTVGHLADGRRHAPDGC